MAPRWPTPRAACSWTRNTSRGTTAAPQRAFCWGSRRMRCATTAWCAFRGPPPAPVALTLARSPRVRQVANLKPNDKDAQLKLKECERVVKELRFASAIASPEDKEARCAHARCTLVCAGSRVTLLSAGGYCRLDRPERHGCAAVPTLPVGTHSLPHAGRAFPAAVVEPSYSGARLGDGDTVTLEFVKQARASVQHSYRFGQQR
jgi:hypothetical protein